MVSDMVDITSTTLPQVGASIPRRCNRLSPGVWRLVMSCVGRGGELLVPASGAVGRALPKCVWGRGVVNGVRGLRGLLGAGADLPGHRVRCVEARQLTIRSSGRAARLVSLQTMTFGAAARRLAQGR